MQIRIEAKETEMGALVEKIENNFKVKSISDFYRNRKKDGVSEYGRVYITIDE